MDYIFGQFEICNFEFFYCLISDDDVFGKNHINDAAKSIISAFNINSVKRNKSLTTSVKERRNVLSKPKERHLSVPALDLEKLHGSEKR